MYRITVTDYEYMFGIQKCFLCLIFKFSIKKVNNLFNAHVFDRLDKLVAVVAAGCVT